MTRYVSIGHRLTGWNAVKNRVQQLGLSLTDDEIKSVTAHIKELADIKPLGIEEVDLFLRKFHEKKVSSPKKRKIDAVVEEKKSSVNH
jgi:homocitrate synthase